VQANIDVVTSLMPLQVGKTVHLARVGRGERGWQAAVSVERYAPVDVPDREAVLLRAALWSEPSGQGRWERRWWYCPSLEYPAKYAAQFEVTSSDGRLLSSSPTSWELTGIRVP
jgi:hypothetical protein